MNNEKLISALRATGQECFVSYLDYFANPKLSNEEIASIIQSERKYTLNSCRSRTSKARSIIKNCKLKDALKLIIDADRTDYQCRQKAQEILNDIEPPKYVTIVRRETQSLPISSPIPKVDIAISPPHTSTTPTNQFYLRKVIRAPSIKFPDLSNTVERELAIMLGKICHHIHPEIANYIEEKNITYREEFKSICHQSCNINSFFYERSDCVFPGFRRPINKEIQEKKMKNEKWKNNIYEKDGTIFNDNTFPRHIWAYLAENKAYSGGDTGMWASSGLAKFELAHVFAHKQDERGLEKKVYRSFSEEPEPYGLFTSSSNIILIPKGFAKPTDHMESVKICFYKRHMDLYHNNIIGLSNFDESFLPSWYCDIDWLEPLLPDDWKLRIDNLLEYRKKYLNSKYSNKNYLTD